MVQQDNIMTPMKIIHHRKGWISFSVAFISLITLAIHANYYMPFIVDDALISLRYANNLLDGYGLVWTDGYPVEGYSNLLWILLTAFLGWLGIDLIDATRILGMIGISFVIGAIVYAYPARNIRQLLPMAVGSLTVVLAAPIAIWTIGGLEQPLLVGLLAWGIILCYPILEKETVTPKEMQLPGLCFALICIIRPDGIIFTITAVVGIILIRGINRTTFNIVAYLIILPVMFYQGQLLFRLIYYGEFVPNTALIKANTSLHRMQEGLRYVRIGIFALRPLLEFVLISLVIMLINKHQRVKAIFLVIPLYAWLVYVVVIGGDVFPGWRHLVPMIVLMALIVAEGMLGLEAYLKSSGHYAILIIILILSASFYMYNQGNDAKNRRVLVELWPWDGQVIGLMLKEGFAEEQPLIAVDAAGTVPYWSGLPAIDMLGLNDYHIARQPSEKIGSGWTGHEFGDGEYVLNRKPDLIMFDVPGNDGMAPFPSGRQMQQNPNFFELYTLTNFVGYKPYYFQTAIWVRRDSPKIGIKRFTGKMPTVHVDNTIIVPSYLINSNPNTVATLDRNNQFFILVSSEPTSIRNLHVPIGKWQVSVACKTILQKDCSSIYVTIQQTGENTVLSSGTSPVYFDVSQDKSQFDITLQTKNNYKIYVQRLILDSVDIFGTTETISICSK